MPKIRDIALLGDDDAPPDDSVAKGTNKHRVELCPFCGAAGAVAAAVQITANTKPDFAVRCPGCDAQGPWAVSPQLAVSLWNFGFQATRPAEGRRTRNQSQPKTKPARSGSAEETK
jgi:hypothetical protein